LEGNKLYPKYTDPRSNRRMEIANCGKSNVEKLERIFNAKTPRGS
jgi:hypothetical protein